MKVGLKKLESLRCPSVKNASFKSIPACDRQTDRQTDTPPIVKLRLSVAECYKTVDGGGLRNGPHAPQTQKSATGGEGRSRGERERREEAEMRGGMLAGA